MYSSGRGQSHLGAAEVATNTAPASLSKLNKSRNGNYKGQAAMHDDGVDEVLPEVLVWRIGDGGVHFLFIECARGR